jgi:hypothetical protein
MALADTLKRAGVTPIFGHNLQLGFNLMEPKDTEHLLRRRRPAFDKRVNPLVSCLLVTTGARSRLAQAIECYRRQAYGARELVIVTHPDGLQAVTQLVGASGASGVSVHCVGREMLLGDCRNVAIARAKGDIVMQWDDDDLYDQVRISVAVALLTQSPAIAAMLSRVLVWWPARRLAAISERRFWEGSLAVWREHAPFYPSLALGEDTPAVDFLASTRPIATYDAPLLYVYTVHGANTWDEPHFEEILERSEHLIEGADYEELIALLTQRMPMGDYEAGASPPKADRPPVIATAGLGSFAAVAQAGAES